MPPTNAVALLVLLVAVLPGSVYTWAFERQASAYGVTLADRVLRFVGVSVVFDLVLAWPAYGVWRVAFAGRSFGGGQFALAWAALFAAFGVPALAGTVVGGLYTSRRDGHGWGRLRRLLTRGGESRLLRLLIGNGRAPRAWDVVFAALPPTRLRIQLVGNGWVAGRFGERSHAGRFPNDADIWLEQAWPITADGVLGTSALDYGLYVPASQIAWIEVIEESDSQEAT
jgi:hypothetical protein